MLQPSTAAQVGAVIHVQPCVEMAEPSGMVEGPRPLSLKSKETQYNPSSQLEKETVDLLHNSVQHQEHRWLELVLYAYTLVQTGTISVMHQRDCVTLALPIQSSDILCHQQYLHSARLQCKAKTVAGDALSCTSTEPSSGQMCPGSWVLGRGADILEGSSSSLPLRPPAELVTCCKRYDGSVIFWLIVALRAPCLNKYLPNSSSDSSRYYRKRVDVTDNPGRSALRASYCEDQYKDSSSIYGCQQRGQSSFVLFAPGMKKTLNLSLMSYTDAVPQETLAANCEMILLVFLKGYALIQGIEHGHSFN
ncbi:hypothetical protein H920_15306 [Fukomys damarensis]|uniref:Uncharacterized protein n=1 Tax=Fukomys damarensis TaxID=885580 RepID=A0A091CZG0_FUKDA|nr:hypothetical protein H920_15306 [Fukomys damarensis]